MEGIVCSLCIYSMTELCCAAETTHWVTAEIPNGVWMSRRLPTPALLLRISYFYLDPSVQSSHLIPACCNLPVGMAWLLIMALQQKPFTGHSMTLIKYLFPDFFQGITIYFCIKGGISEEFFLLLGENYFPCWTASHYTINHSLKSLKYMECHCWILWLLKTDYGMGGWFV